MKSPIIIKISLVEDGSDLTGSHRFPTIGKAIIWLKKEFKKAKAAQISDRKYEQALKIRGKT